jgi:hypothetical protein
MHSDYTHYLITRYNVMYPGWKKDKLGVQTLGADWMKHRYDVFTRYCLPSVINQSEKNFRWLIYIDRATDPLFSDQLKKVISESPHFEIREVSGYDACIRDIDMLLSDAVSRYVITSRLDNDDCLGKEYISIVQGNFISQDKTILNLLNGDGYDIHRQVATRMRHRRNNHFTSLVEIKRSGGGHKSVIGYPHDQPPRDYKIIDIASDHSWLKIFHERNLKSFLFGIPVFSKHDHGIYGVSEKNLAINYYHTIAYAAHWLAGGIQRKLLRKKSSSSSGNVNAGN